LPGWLNALPFALRLKIDVAPFSGLRGCKSTGTCPPEVRGRRPLVLVVGSTLKRGTGRRVDEVITDQVITMMVVTMMVMKIVQNKKPGKRNQNTRRVRNPSVQVVVIPGGGYK